MTDNITYTRRGVVIDGNYIISDLHLGYSTEINSMTKRDEKSQITYDLTDVLDQEEVDTVIINGDIFHEFGKPSEDALQIFDSLLTRTDIAGCDIILIEGNHDTNVDQYVSPHTMREDHSFQYKGSKVTVLHGHKKWSDYSDTDMFILGHLHPVAKINGVEWPTYLQGDISSKNFLVLPAFSKYQDGVTVSDKIKLDIDFPFIETRSFGLLSPYVYDSDEDEVREFPKLSESSRYFGV